MLTKIDARFLIKPGIHQRARLRFGWEKSNEDDKEEKNEKLGNDKANRILFCESMLFGGDGASQLPVSLPGVRLKSKGLVSKNTFGRYKGIVHQFEKSVTKSLYDKRRRNLRLTNGDIVGLAQPPLSSASVLSDINLQKEEEENREKSGVSRIGA